MTPVFLDDFQPPQQTQKHSKLAFYAQAAKLVSVGGLKFRTDIVSHRFLFSWGAVRLKNYTPSGKKKYIIIVVNE